MKKLAYIFMVFDTLEERHIKQALESFDLQDKSYIDTFIIYNNSTTFKTDWIKTLVNGVDKIDIIDKNLPTDKRMVSDVNYHLKNIEGFDIYLLHKSDFYLPSNTIKSVYEKLTAIEARFINFGKFDMREDINGDKINELNLSNMNSFTDVVNGLDIATPTFHNITLDDRLIGYQGTDGTMHAYNELARMSLVFNSFLSQQDWDLNQNQVEMLYDYDDVFSYHMWHDIGTKTDNKHLGKNIIGHRF
tara:strand:+ start:1400 stop:2137 length:738 start_codon:yes stop_codon:yes gene_type:complete